MILLSFFFNVMLLLMLNTSGISKHSALQINSSQTQGCKQYVMHAHAYPNSLSLQLASIKKL